MEHCAPAVEIVYILNSKLIFWEIALPLKICVYNYLNFKNELIWLEVMLYQFSLHFINTIGSGIGIGKLIDDGGGVKVLTIMKVVKKSRAKVSCQSESLNSLQVVLHSRGNGTWYTKYLSMQVKNKCEDRSSDSCQEFYSLFLLLRM